MDDYDELVLKAVDYIEKHLTEELRLDEIAGVTPGNCIRDRRLTEAARELCGSDRRIIDIAVEYGFESQVSFTSSFKKIHRLPPASSASGA